MATIVMICPYEQEGGGAGAETCKALVSFPAEITEPAGHNFSGYLLTSVILTKDAWPKSCKSSSSPLFVPLAAAGLCDA